MILAGAFHFCERGKSVFITQEPRKRLRAGITIRIDLGTAIAATAPAIMFE
jgi:hypothetical protein